MTAVVNKSNIVFPIDQDRSPAGLHLVFADTGYRGAARRLDTSAGANWRITLRPGRAPDKDNEINALVDRIEKLKASVRSKVEHPFRVIKRQFGHGKVRYRGLEKNTTQHVTLFALSNLWMARGRLLAVRV